jgi:hypothetical protein
VIGRLDSVGLWSLATDGRLVAEGAGPIAAGPAESLRRGALESVFTLD